MALRACFADTGCFLPKLSQAARRAFFHMQRSGRKSAWHGQIQFDAEVA
jgi:hypothetical protein